MVVKRTRHPMGCRVPACLGGLRALPISLDPGHSESPLVGEISLQGVWGTLLEDQETMTDAFASSTSAERQMEMQYPPKS